jgi:DNA replication protein DnaC
MSDNIFTKAAAANRAARQDFRFVKHNKTDYASFIDYQNSVNKKFEKVEKENKRLQRKMKLMKWDESLAARWRGASLNKIENEAAAKALEIINKSRKTNFYITGDTGSGKTYLAYAILRRYIGFGFINPSQIKVVSEEEVMSYASGGFTGRDKFEELLKDQYKVYVLDNVAAKESYTTRETANWEQLLEHIYKNSLTVIFTSNETRASFASILSNSTSLKFKELSEDRVLTVKGTRTPDFDDDPDLLDTTDSATSLLDQFAD